MLSTAKSHLRLCRIWREQALKLTSLETGISTTLKMKHLLSQCQLKNWDVTVSLQKGKMCWRPHTRCISDTLPTCPWSPVNFRISKIVPHERDAPLETPWKSQGSCKLFLWLSAGLPTAGNTGNHKQMRVCHAHYSQLINMQNPLMWNIKEKL